MEEEQKQKRPSLLMREEGEEVASRGGHREEWRQEQGEEEQKDHEEEDQKGHSTEEAATCAPPDAAISAELIIPLAVLPAEDHYQRDDHDHLYNDELASAKSRGRLSRHMSASVAQTQQHDTAANEDLAAAKSRGRMNRPSDNKNIATNDNSGEWTPSSSAASLQQPGTAAARSNSSPTTRNSSANNTSKEEERDSVQTSSAPTGRASLTTPGAISVPGRRRRSDEVDTTVEDNTEPQSDVPNSSSTTMPDLEEGRESDAYIDAGSSNDVLVQAELVPPTVQAVSVVIDEEHPHHHRPSENSTRGGVITSGNEHSEGDNEYEKHATTTTDPRKKGRRINAIHAMIILCVAVIVIVVVTAVVVSKNKNSSIGDNVNTPIDNATTTTAAETFDYLCFTSTRALLDAQIEDFIASNFTKTRDRYILCPGTYIDLGTFKNPAINDFHIVDGDFPLVVMAPDTVVQCGLDGRRNNSCVLDGGFVQVLLQTEIPGIDFEIEFGTDHEVFLNLDLTVHNVTFRGLTFTGIMAPVGPFVGLSFLMSQSGNVTVEDCRWTDMTTSGTAVSVGENAYQVTEAGGFTTVPKQSAHLTARNCQFDNIVYDNPLLAADDQILHVENCIFSNITTSVLPTFRCDTRDDGGCTMILGCLGDSLCSMSHSCLEDVEIMGPSLILASPTSNFVNSPLHAPESSLPSLEMTLASYNNFLDEGTQAAIPCEVAVANVTQGGDNEPIGSGFQFGDVISLSCLQGLAFEATECALTKGGD